MLESLTQLVSGSPWTYAIVLAFAALDAVFPIVPSEATVIAAGVLAGAGELEVALVIAAAASGALIGDHLGYAVGRSASRLSRRPLLRGRQASAERLLEQRGFFLIVVGRFIPGGRTAATVTAGLTGMARRRFLGAAALAAALWASFAGGLGYLGGRAFEAEPWRGLVAAFVVAATLAAGLELTRRLLARRRLDASARPAT